MLYNEALTFESFDKILKCTYKFIKRALEPNFPVVLLIMVYKVVLNFETE